MATSDLDRLTNGITVTPQMWNDMTDAVNLLLAKSLSLGGTIGNITQDPGAASGSDTKTPDGSGNFNISYGVTFNAAPAVMICGSGLRPNTMVTVSASGPGPSAFTVHCQDVTTGNPITNGTVQVYWAAIRKS